MSPLLFTDPASPEEAAEQHAPLLFTFLGTPVRLRGAGWIPITPLVLWAAFTHLMGQRHPEASRSRRVAAGALMSLLAVASEWGHNMAHAAAAVYAEAPMDELYVLYGTPRSVYYVNDDRITPDQHRIRAAGGPIFNTLLLVVCLLLRPVTRRQSLARDLLDVLLGTQVFLVGAGMMPVPGLDGGPLLKWTLVSRGHTPDEADAMLRQLNLGLGASLAVTGTALLKGRRWWLGGGLLGYGIGSLLVGLGLLKE